MNLLYSQDDEDAEIPTKHYEDPYTKKMLEFYWSIRVDGLLMLDSNMLYSNMIRF